jgi:hypothetical protein
MDRPLLVARKRVIRYQEFLENASDDRTREALRRLIAECEAELQRLESPPSEPKFPI